MVPFLTRASVFISNKYIANKLSNTLIHEARSFGDNYCLNIDFKVSISR